jgi:prepilin-type N-terminal cleavage/methylation domain-containing protein
MKNKGFTLLEALIASTIFAMVAMVGANIFINISHSERKTELANSLYEDARVVLETLATEIRESTIDYEEYYNIEVLESGVYGINRGVYGSRFYDPGYKIGVGGAPEVGSSPDHLGVEWLNDEGDKAGPGEEFVVYPLSVDKNLGRNPYDKDEPENSASAFCEPAVTTPPVGGCSKPEEGHSELYLISEDGREKTTIIKQLLPITGDSVISILEMEGLDLDNNGIVDVFTCDNKVAELCETEGQLVSDGYEFDHPHPSSFNTEGLSFPINDNETFTISDSPFSPISPRRSNITELKFIIWPDEDPYKAFAESDIQYHPNVTIIISMEPSASEIENYPGENIPKVTLQTTVSTGVLEKVETYPPTKDLSWIKEVDAFE